MTRLLLVFTLLFSTSAFANKPSASDTMRAEITANPHRYGETIEVGFVTPSLFKFKQDSRHFWSAFGSFGMHTLSNVSLDSQATVEEEIINFEVVGGIFALADFYNDFIAQYGKVALDLHLLNSKLDETPIGILLESGLEFKSSVAEFGWSKATNPISAHIGLRWRAGFSTLDKTAGDVDLIEGISMTVGTRITF